MNDQQPAITGMLDNMSPIYKTIFLDFLKSPAAVEIAREIAYDFGDNIYYIEISKDDNLAKLALAAYNQGLLAGQVK